MTRQTKAAPATIWLQWHGDAHPDEPGEPDPAEVTWCQDQVYEHDIEYVRADQRDKLLAALMKATQALGDLSFECDGVIGRCSAPSVATYNRTFSVLQESRAIIAEVEAGK